MFRAGLDLTIVTGRETSRTTTDILSPKVEGSQIDAHLDWRDEVHGERYGYSSPMCRASKMPHVAGIVQVGLRSVGSARLTEIEAAGTMAATSRAPGERRFYAELLTLLGAPVRSC